MSACNLLRVRSTRGDRESGRAIIEFVALGVLLLVPLVYLVMFMGRLQAGSFAASFASREAGRAYLSGSSDADAEARARAAAQIAFADFGETGVIEISCDGTPCLRPEGRVTVRASLTVGLPLVPDVVSEVVPAGADISETQVVVVDRWRAQ